MWLYWLYISTTHWFNQQCIVIGPNNINPDQNINLKSNIWTPYFKLIIRHHKRLGGHCSYLSLQALPTRLRQVQYEKLWRPTTESVPDPQFWMPSSTLIEPFYSSRLIFLIKIGLLHWVVNSESWCLQDSPSISHCQTAIYASSFLHLICGIVLSDFYCPSVIFWPCFPFSSLVDQTP